VAGAAVIARAVRITAAGEGAEGVRAAKRLFGASIVYLFVLFAALLIDHWLGGPGRVFL
jgi:protoheme IX farnesyltransferase